MTAKRGALEVQLPHPQLVKLTSDFYQEKCGLDNFSCVCAVLGANTKYLTPVFGGNQE